MDDILAEWENGFILSQCSCPLPGPGGTAVDHDVFDEDGNALGTRSIYMWANVIMLKKCNFAHFDRLCNVILILGPTTYAMA